MGGLIFIIAFFLGQDSVESKRNFRLTQQELIRLDLVY